MSIQNAIGSNAFLSPDAKKSLSALMTAANNDLGQFQTHLENWFNHSMDRVSGWYKRQAQKIIVCLAVVTCIVLNVDSIRLVESLYRDNGLRALAVAAAQQYTNQVLSSSTGTASASFSNAVGTAIDVQAQLGQTKLPMGWPDECWSNSWANVEQEKGEHYGQAVFDTSWMVVVKLLGWLITLIAISLGAPFWFDMLDKLVNLRLAGDPPDTNKKTNT